MHCSYVGALVLRGDHPNAIKHARMCMDLCTKHAGAKSPCVAVALLDTGAARLGAGDYRGAAEVLGRAALFHEKRDGVLSRNYALVLAQLASAESRLGRLGLAEKHLLHALSVRRTLFGDNSLTVASLHSNIVGVLVQRGKAKQALEHSEHAARIQRVVIPRTAQLAQTLGNLAIANISNGKKERAIKLAKESLKQFQRLYPRNNHINLVNAHTLYGTLLRYSGDNKRSLKQLQRAVTLSDKVYKADHPQKVNPIIELGHSQVALKKYADARVTLEHAVALSAKPNVPPPWVAEAKFALAKVLRTLKRDNARQRTLAAEASAIYAKLGQGFKQQVAKISTWLKSNPPH